MPKYAARIDTTHEEIVTCLRLINAGVQSMATIGKGCPDLLISYRGKWYVAEVKSGTKDFESDQLAWQERHKAPVLRFNSAGDAMAWAKEVSAL
jgi:hypothetical protein